MGEGWGEGFVMKSKLLTPSLSSPNEERKKKFFSQAAPGNRGGFYFQVKKRDIIRAAQAIANFEQSRDKPRNVA